MVSNGNVIFHLHLPNSKCPEKSFRTPRYLKLRLSFSLEEHSTVSAGKLEQDVLETSIESPAIDIQSPFVFLECEASKMQLFSAKRACPTITLN